MKKYTLKKNSIGKVDALKEKQTIKNCNNQNQLIFIKQKAQTSKTSDRKVLNCLDHIHQNNFNQIEIVPLKNKDMNKQHYSKGSQKPQPRFKAISFTNNCDYQSDKNINLITPRNYEQKPNRTKNKKIKTQQKCKLQKYLNIWKEYFKFQKQCFIFDELSYKQMMILLNQLNFIRNDCESKYNISFDSQKQELKKVYNLWIYLCGQSSHVRLVNLVLFLMSFEKIKLNISCVEDAVNQFQAQMYKTYPLISESNYNKNPQNIFLINIKTSVFDNKQIILCNEQKEDFYKQFQVFKIHKLSLKTQNSLKLRTHEQQNQISIGSMLSPKSNQLALTYRKQLVRKLKDQGCQIKNQNMTVFDLLTLNKLKSQQHYPQQINTKKLKIETKFICLSDFKQKLNQLSSPKFHHQKQPDEIAYEKQKNQYTFRPTISRSLSRRSSNSEIKNLQKTAIRMKTARDIKEDKLNLMNKGWACKKPNLQIQINKKALLQINKCCQSAKEQRRNTIKLQQYQEEIIYSKHYEQDQLQLFQSKQLTQNQLFTSNLSQKKQQSQKSCHPYPESNNSQEFKQCEQQQNQSQFYKKTQFNQQSTTQEIKRTIKNYLKIPILYVDVNIQQGKKQRIVIFQDDNPKNLSIDFGKKHNLPSQTILRLQEMLIQQISTILVRIDEETDEDCSIL